MGTTQRLIREAYKEHFSKLREIAADIEHLNRVIQEVEDTERRQLLARIIHTLKVDMKKYAENLETRGVELFYFVA